MRQRDSISGIIEDNVEQAKLIDIKPNQGLVVELTSFFPKKTMQELETAISEKLGCKVIVLQPGQHVVGVLNAKELANLVQK